MATRNQRDRLSAFVRLGVLGWSGALMTASYLGLMPRGDITFVASVFTAALSSFGLDRSGSPSQTATRPPSSSSRRRKPPTP